eukprot:208603-Ditylum_brightwellii.AAC.1
MKLCPQSGVSGMYIEVQHEARDPKGRLYDYTDGTLLPVFKQMQTGKVVGPFADITDTLHDVATER